MTENWDSAETADAPGEGGGVATEVPEYAGAQANEADGITRDDAYDDEDPWVPETSSAAVLEQESPDAASQPDEQPGENLAVPDAPTQADLARQLDGLRDQMQAQIDQRLEVAETRYQAGLDSLKAEYEAGKTHDQQQIADLRAELQALRDDRRPAEAELPGHADVEAGQPRADARSLPVSQVDATEAKHEDDRPGFWSNAKYALYGAVGSTVALAGADQFVPGAPHAVVDLAAGALTIAAASVPTLREGWKKRHD